MTDLEYEKPEEEPPIPKLPSWTQMLAHLNGQAATQAANPPGGRRPRKVTFETPDDKDEDEQ